MKKKEQPVSDEILGGATDGGEVLYRNSEGERIDIENRLTEKN